MKDFVLYCKSYARDFLRLKRLLESINQFNSDRLDFYISTPKADKNLLEESLGKNGYIWIADEEIVAANPHADLEKYKAMPGSLSQQIIKSEFWRLGFSENYLCLDSDSFFIRTFYKSDFLSSDGVPYTVLHQNKELFQLAADRGHEKVGRDLKLEAERVKALFHRKGPNFYCAPAPFIWSAKVWQSLAAEYLEPEGISLWDFISPDHPETLIYGETLQRYRAIPLIAIEPLFRTYHYDWQYFLMRRLGETEFKVAQNYLGIIYQSAWEAELNLGQSQKSLPSQLLKRIKRFGRYLQSFI
ncbi:hypothetical protein A8O14_01330 [Polynucleobacter wuianus]|uniref:Glycosyl transferase n=1 Tax=Polynucleobacter wuianus TaxID=1743168 RepID=A0A191UD81_9BURK|nr:MULTISPECIES: DUF6492 family protein [Polynucleobacter]ANI98855.1 hypothetical protein A8O14_01330 [Polynucleobacter wuianus]MBU3553431.1 hypothetical protein [Polynucleobacter sp. MWH-Post4-6-1]MBU3610178.1 hypothetical protein [Polynucleobacter wuianus]